MPEFHKLGQNEHVSIVCSFCTECVNLFTVDSEKMKTDIIKQLNYCFFLPHLLLVNVLGRAANGFCVAKGSASGKYSKCASRGS